MAAYASKSYVLSFSRSIAYEPEVQKSGYIGTLCPGPVATNFIRLPDFRESWRYVIRRCAKYAVKKMMRGKKLIIRVYR